MLESVFQNPQFRAEMLTDTLRHLKAVICNKEECFVNFYFHDLKMDEAHLLAKGVPLVTLQTEETEHSLSELGEGVEATKVSQPVFLDFTMPTYQEQQSHNDVSEKVEHPHLAIIN